MDLSDIRKSISSMTDDELRSQLTEIRSNRRVTKRPPTATKKAANPAISGASADSLIKGMTAEQAETLLKLLGG